MTRKKTKVKVEEEQVETAPLLTEDVKIIYYYSQCGCHRGLDWPKIYNRILNIGGDIIHNYEERRVEYEPKWYDEAQKLGIVRCGFLITWPDGEQKVLTQDQFKEAYCGE